MSAIHANVPTSAASRYLQQLCKHWSHKFVVTFTPSHGEIVLQLGRCVLDADSVKLSVSLYPEAGTDVQRFKEVVQEHIVRFAFRETLHFDWQDGERGTRTS
ncbi:MULTISPECIES: DUF2218 domain-containing protein [unclassified Chelatococcus]|uniref:DUF2218 domain-containing protein n=1 Tax=unclassified Chelatococcus TaxID=2638111 RepID=UPI001BD12CC8|nr:MULTISPECIES: DUF2218 domain-containing protein [unclassified Chelatococcus]MBS7701128.1 DUF2218 domain-containing protein [Chelatococcus sp. YT9]MBX3557259.1 DUF2218 domain-containing protein [Chelatococcus sp.]